MIVKFQQYFREFTKGAKTKGSFTRNFTVTFSGHMISVIIGFAFTPFIARVYGPEAYGIFAFFTAVASCISPLATLQLPSGFVAAKNDNEFYDLLRLTTVVLVLGTILVLVVIVVFGQNVFQTFSDVDLGMYVYLIPVYFFLMGLDNLLSGWNIRLKEFNRSAFSRVFSVCLSKGATLAAGFFYQAAPLGMIVGNVLTYPVDSFFKISARLSKDFTNFRTNNLSTLNDTIRKFRGYPLFITPGVIISNLSSQLPIYFFSLAFAPAYSGYFALAGSLVSTPLSIIINSTTTVFLQKAAEILHHYPERIGAYVLELYKKLFFVGAILLVGFALVSDWLFKYVFGDVWELSGDFASFLAVSAVLSVPANPLMVIFRLMFREKINFFINVLFVFIKASVLWVGSVFYQDIMVSILLYCAVTIMNYGVYLYFIFKLSKLDTKVIFRDVAIVSVILAALVFLKS